MPQRPNFSTSTCTTSVERSAGQVGPSRIKRGQSPSEFKGGLSPPSYFMFCGIIDWKYRFTVAADIFGRRIWSKTPATDPPKNADTVLSQ